MLLGAARDGNAQAQYWIGSQLHATAACHPRADGSVWLRHAAAGGSSAAQLALAQSLLAGSPDEGQLERVGTLLKQAATSDSYYVRKHTAALLAAAPEAPVRDPATARRLALQLAAGPLQSDPEMFEVVAAAHAANGEFREAATQQAVAIDKAQRLGWNTHAMAERLASYRAQRPWNGELLGAT